MDEMKHSYDAGVDRRVKRTRGARTFNCKRNERGFRIQWSALFWKEHVVNNMDFLLTRDERLRWRVQSAFRRNVSSFDLTFDPQRAKACAIWIRNITVSTREVATR